MILKQFCKGTRETLDYALDFYRDLEAGESITAASAVVAPDTLTITRVTFSDVAAKVWLTGGVDGVNYVVTVTVDTSAGRRMEKAFAVQTRGDIVTVTSVAIADTEVTVGYLNDYTPALTLTTSGSQILRTSGEPVTIKAVNWFGFESANRIVHGLWADGYKAHIDRIAAMGFNALRIPFAGDTFTTTAPTGVNFTFAGNTDFEVGTTGVARPAIECLDIIIAYAASKGLWIILDAHRRTVGSGADGNPVGVGQTLEQWIATWETLATRYASNKAVVGADVYNEPYLLTWNAWAALAEQAGNAIHLIAPKWLIIVEGVSVYNSEAYWFGGQLRGVPDRPVQLNVQNRLVYSPHEYGQSVSEQPWLKSAANPDVLNWPANLQSIWHDAWGFISAQGIAPVLVGEFGGKFGYDGAGLVNQPNAQVERDWGENLAEYLAENGTSFAYWAYNPNSADTGGLVQDDWVTLQAGKLAILSPLLGS